MSMMPDDQLKTMKEEEVRALFAYLQSPVQTPLLATAENVKDFFNGKDLTGWDGDPKLWTVEKGEIVGKSPGLKKNEFLRSQMIAGDFRLTLKVRLTPNKENSGVQFHSELLPGGEVKGPQADVGAGWWGKLYEEHGRGLLWDRSGEVHVKAGRVERVRHRGGRQPGADVDQRQAVRGPGRCEAVAAGALRVPDPFGRSAGGAVQGHPAGGAAVGGDAEAGAG